MSIKNEIVERITLFYLTSGDFNGTPILSVGQTHNLKRDELVDITVSLVQEGRISVEFGDRHPNPHIKALGEETPEIQIRKLRDSNLGHVCLYPARKILEKKVDKSEFSGMPFKLRLALGEPQLSFLSFDLSVLEYYRNDPRYYYYTDGIDGSISISDRYFEGMLESDRIVLQSFGFSYDSDLNRAVAVFLRYLSVLTAEHQQIWHAKLLSGDFKLHPSYARRSAGYWDAEVSIFDAFIEEIFHINKMCELMGKPPLFKNDFKEEHKPRNFSFLIRPTSREYNDFVLLLDKMISENINRSFFLGDIPLERDQPRRNGKRTVLPKNTIALLDEWLTKRFLPRDRKPLVNMIKTFKEIRRLRQRPAHAIDEDVFDKGFLGLQRELIVKAYQGIRTIRLIFANHPSVRGYKVPEWLSKGEICTY